MNEMFALKILTDICYYMFAVSSLTTLAPHSGMLITSPLIVAISAFFCLYFARRFPSKKYVRYYPMALCAVCFVFTHTVMDVLVTVPMIAYLGVLLFMERIVVDYDNQLESFYLFLKLLPAPAFLTILTSNTAGFLNVMLPYFMCFAIISIMTLRMLRHSARIYKDTRFRIINIAEMGMLCGFGYLLSSGLLMVVVRFIWGLLVDFIFKPLAAVIAYIFGGIGWLMGKIFGGIDFSLEGMELSGLDDLGSVVSEGEQSMLEYYKEEATDSPASQAFLYILTAVGILIIVIVLIVLFRAMIRAARRQKTNQFDDVRESVDVKSEGRRKRLSLSYRDRVRNVYRRFLKMCYKMGVDPEENLDSRDINKRVESTLNRPALKGLRDVYIRARYSSEDITAEDLKAAKTSLDKIHEPE